MNKIRPHLELAEKMGALMGQLNRNPHDVTITYCGEVTQMDTRPITHAALKGFLGAYTDKPLNYVSAPAIARCGGFSDFANPERVKLLRSGQATQHDVRSLGSKDNITLKPGDQINVPAKRIGERFRKN